MITKTLEEIFDDQERTEYQNFKQILEDLNYYNDKKILGIAIN